MNKTKLYVVDMQKNYIGVWNEYVLDFNKAFGDDKYMLVVNDDEYKGVGKYNDTLGIPKARCFLTPEEARLSLIERLQARINTLTNDLNHIKMQKAEDIVFESHEKN